MVSPLPEGPLSQLKLMLSPWNCRGKWWDVKTSTFAHCESTHSKTTESHFRGFTPNTQPYLEFLVNLLSYYFESMAAPKSKVPEAHRVVVQWNTFKTFYTARTTGTLWLCTDPLSISCNIINDSKESDRLWWLANTSAEIPCVFNRKIWFKWQHLKSNVKLATHRHIDGTSGGGIFTSFSSFTVFISKAK